MESLNNSRFTVRTSTCMHFRKTNSIIDCRALPVEGFCLITMDFPYLTAYKTDWRRNSRTALNMRTNMTTLNGFISTVEVSFLRVPLKNYFSYILADAQEHNESLKRFFLPQIVHGSCSTNSNKGDNELCSPMSSAD